jgi:N-acetyl sugar amidotransferase
MSEVHRCGTCILPDSLPGVTLDNHGVCNYCRDFNRRESQHPLPSEEKRHEQLDRLVKKYRKRAGTYDCLVPVSGGKDSMLVLHAASRLLHFKVLAYNFDNGFQSAAARENIQRAVKTLGVDLITYKPNEEQLHKLFKVFLTRAGEFCTPCNLIIQAAAFRIAAQNRIPLILSGGSSRVFGGIQGVSASKYADRAYYRHVLEGQVDFKEVARFVVENPWKRAIRRYLHIGPTLVEVLDYVYPGLQQARDLLEKELGWRPTSGELEHGDCTLNPLKDYVQNRKWGYSEVTQSYSSLVRTKQLTREEALHHAEAEETREPPPVLEHFLAQIKMSRQEFDQTVHRHFSEFPNYPQSALYRAGKRAVALLRKGV